MNLTDRMMVIKNKDLSQLKKKISLMQQNEFIQLSLWCVRNGFDDLDF